MATAIDSMLQPSRDSADDCSPRAVRAVGGQEEAETEGVVTTGPGGRGLWGESRTTASYVSSRRWWCWWC